LLQSTFSGKFVPSKLFGHRQWSSDWIFITLLLLITALAAALRIYQLDAGGLWFDEIFHALLASPDKSLTEIAQGSLPIPWPSPPLWFFMTHFFIKLFGVSDGCKTEKMAEICF